MSEDFGDFIWYELMTGDVAAAAGFYGAVTGWNAKVMNMPSMDYTVLEMPGAPVGVGGIMELDARHRAEGIPPNWTGYITVDDVDLCAADVVMMGGALNRQPEDIPGVGRFAVAADPQGAVFIIFAPQPMEEPPPSPGPDAPGSVSWHELMTPDPEAAFGFYSRLFGWERGEAFDMGEMGVYQLFTVHGVMRGGIMKTTPETPTPFWAFYINVEALDAALERVTAAGGTVLNGPVEVPGGSFVAQALDPQGAFFCLLAPRR